MKVIQTGFLLLSVLIFGNSKGQQWKQYVDSAQKYSKNKNNAKALEFYLKANNELKQDSAGTEELSNNSNSIGTLYFGLGQYKMAEPFFVEVLGIREKILGKDYPDYAETCNNLGVLYNTTGQYEKAEGFYLEAKQIRERILGKENQDYAQSCNSLGALYFSMNKYEKAEELYLEAKQIRKKVLGKDHPYYASTCENLAMLYKTMGQYEKAEDIYLEVKQTRENVLGKEHQDYARSCNNLGVLYNTTGQYGKAEEFFLEAKQIREKVLGKNHPLYALSCNNLGVLYFTTGQYEKAEDLYIEAKQLREKIVGKQSQDYAASCNNLAVLYRNTGQYKKAEDLYLEAKQIWEKILNKQHPNYAQSCDNLGTLYSTTGQYDKAEGFYLEAKQIWEKLFNKEHPDYATSAMNLAILYTVTGQYEKAENLFLEAKQVFEKVLGKEHSHYATICDKLGTLYSSMGDYVKAESLYLDAKKIREKILGKEYAGYAASCNNLGNLYRNLNKPEIANENFREAYQSQNLQVNKIFQFTSEVEQRSYLNANALFEKYFLSFNLSDYPGSDQDLAYTICLSNRNLILSSSQQLHKMIYSAGDTIASGKYNNWSQLKEQLAFWYTKPVAQRPVYIIDMEERSNTLEKELKVLSTAFKKEQSGNEISWKAIQKNLKMGEAAIEFSAFRYYSGSRWTDSIYYTALVVKKDDKTPTLIKLFEQKQLDSLLNYRNTSPGQHTLTSLYTKSENKKNSLYDLIWRPLESKLNDISVVFFAPAGSLHKISFAALPVRTGEVLSDKYKLIQLNTTASVTGSSVLSLSGSDKIIMYGGIKYDADSSSIKNAALKYSANDVASRSLPDDLSRDGVPEFTYLEGTAKEINEIRKLAEQMKYTVNLADGVNATEESIKSLAGKNSPAVLHIATHGFFFPDPKDRKEDDRMGGITVFLQSANPLIRSGLALAGANNAWKGKPVHGVEDGILTSYEMSNMYLPNTKLVVLSACETGLGDIQGSEGVYGLQRAFKIAGAENLVMSLWKVDDIATVEFMQEFYKNLFLKQTINDAFYNAQEIMKNKYRKDPYKWAAWVLVR